MEAVLNLINSPAGQWSVISPPTFTHPLFLSSHYLSELDYTSPIKKTQGWVGELVSIVACYGLASLGFEPLKKQDFVHLSKTRPDAHPASCMTGSGSFPRG